MTRSRIILFTLALVFVAVSGRKFNLKNNCKQTVWVGALGNPVPGNGGFSLAPGKSNSVSTPDSWTGRFWGRTGCKFDKNGNGHCDTGDCGNKLKCNGAGGNPPVTLAEFTLKGSGGQDFYDVSLVDGYNLPMKIEAKGCTSAGCVKDLNPSCPSELQQKAGNKVVACLSACEKFNTDEYCCRGSHNKPETCPPTKYSTIFKKACPQAYSYAYDDKTSTFTCKSGKDYVITFCP